MVIPSFAAETVSAENEETVGIEAVANDADKEAETAETSEEAAETVQNAESIVVLETEAPAEETPDGVKEEAVVENEKEEIKEAAADEKTEEAEEVAKAEESEPVKEAEEAVVEEAIEEETVNPKTDAIMYYEDPDSGIAVVEADRTLNVGKTHTLVLSGVSNKIGSYTVEWTSDNTGVASVSNGKVKGVSAGRANITGYAVVKDGKKYLYAKYRYGVFGTATGIDINDVSVGVGKTLEFSFKASPEYSNIDNVSVLSNDDTVVTASMSMSQLPGTPVQMSCSVTGRRNGKAKLTVAIKSNGKTVTKTINVKVSTGIRDVRVELNRSSLIVGNGCKMRLKATPVPANTAVRWESMNTNTATVSSDGVVTAVNKGTVNIICYPVSDPHAVASCKVTVKEPVSKIVLLNTSASVWKGKSIMLTGTTAPRSAYSTVRWSSSDTKVCTVDSNGKVTAVGRGTATITCAAADGSGKRLHAKSPSRSL